MCVCADAKVTSPTMTSNVQIFAQSNNSSLDIFEISVDITQSDIACQNAYNLDDVKIPGVCKMQNTELHNNKITE